MRLARSTRRLGPALVVALLVDPRGAADAHADECQPEYLKARVPNRAQRPIARNAQLFVGEATDCGRALPGPTPEYRLMTADGSLPLTRALSAFDTLTLRADRALPPGPAELEVREPVNDYDLGPWRTLRSLTVGAHTDHEAPDFDGLVSARAKIVTGTVFISPCEATEEPMVETTVVFRLAEDDATPRDDLLYRLDRRPESGGDWEVVRVFLPRPYGNKLGSYSVRDGADFGKTWRYRVRVIDTAGHETVGADEWIVTAPSRPREPRTRRRRR